MFDVDCCIIQLMIILFRLVKSRTDRENLTELQEWTNVIDVSKEIIKKSLKSDFKDFEDAIQYNCAKSLNKIDGIVTRDTKDYKTSTLPIFTPKEALTLIESNNH